MSCCSRRTAEGVKPIRHETAPRPCGTFARRFRCRRITVGTIPRGTTRLISHGHSRRDGYAAGDDANLSQPDDCFPIWSVSSMVWANCPVLISRMSLDSLSSSSTT